VTTLLSVAAGLALVLGLLLVGAGLLRRFGGSPASPRRQIEVLDRVGLSPKQGVALVRLRDREVAVGYGEGGVRLLTEMEPDPAAAPRDADDFSGVLARVEETDAAVVRPGGRGLAGRWPAPGRPGTGSGVWNRVRSALRQALAGVGVAAVVGGLGLLATHPTAAAAQGTGADVPGVSHLPDELQPGAGTTPQGDARTGPRLLDVLDRAEGMPSFTLQAGDADDEPLVLSGPVGLVVFMGFLTLLPTLLLLMTSFTRILVVLNLLKQALGLQTAPPGHLIVALSLLLTGFVMAPTLNEANATAFAPWVEGSIDEAEMLRRGVVPFREFMLNTTGEEELATMVDLSADAAPASVAEIPTMTLTSAFVMSELRAAFQMGFALFLPFVVIDIVVASVLMSMGMFMLPPVMVSLPLKLLLFVLVDGWSLIVGGLIRSFV
jgi:flagellar biosynthetic protein FliP